MFYQGKGDGFLPIVIVLCVTAFFGMEVVNVILLYSLGGGLAFMLFAGR